MNDAYDEVLFFIQNLKASSEYMEILFKNGDCYKFHLLLKSMWTSAIPYIDKKSGDHVITEINGRFYDISGEVSESNYRKMSEIDIKMAEKWSFAKKYVLSVGECEYCGEPILIS